MLWSAKEMPDGQHQRVDMSAHVRIAHKGLLQKTLEQDLGWIVPHDPPPTHHPPPMTQSVKGLKVNKFEDMGLYSIGAKCGCCQR